MGKALWILFYAFIALNVCGGVKGWAMDDEDAAVEDDNGTGRELEHARTRKKHIEGYDGRERTVAESSILAGIGCWRVMTAFTTYHGVTTETEWVFEAVTCGSVVKLLHMQTNHRLHSHEVNYGGGSGQQSVTGVPQGDDNNSYWIVKGGHGQRCQQGMPIKNGQVIRLEHVKTRKNLHSHEMPAPLSGADGLEVSCFGSNGQGDQGDNWVVQVIEGTDYWMRGEPVRFKHQHSKGLLMTHRKTFSRPIQGHQEVYVKRGASKGRQYEWKTEEGIFLPSTINLESGARIEH